MDSENQVREGGYLMNDSLVPKKGPGADAVDDIDRKILGVLIQDSRITYSELASIVGISRISVKERVLSMQKREIIEKFTIQIPAKYLGKPLPVFFEIQVSPETIHKVAEALSEHPDITIVYQMTGMNCLHVHAFFVNVEDVSAFINEFLSSLPGIQSVNTQFLLKRYKADRSMVV
jgi:DNA-binding Lrp family transcriptional regulator